MGSILNNMKSLLQSQEASSREYLASVLRFQPDTNIEILLEASWKYFYYFKTNYLFLFYPAKTRNKNKKYILINKFTVWLINRKLISIKQNLLIKEICEEAHADINSSHNVR